MNKKIVVFVILVFCALGVYVWLKQMNAPDSELKVPSPENVTRYEEELSLLKSDLASIGASKNIELTNAQVLELKELITAAQEKMFELQKTQGKFRDVVKADLEFLLEDIKDKTRTLKQEKSVVQ